MQIFFYFSFKKVNCDYIGKVSGKELIPRKNFSLALSSPGRSSYNWPYVEKGKKRGEGWAPRAETIQFVDDCGYLSTYVYPELRAQSRDRLFRFSYHMSKVVLDLLVNLLS